MAKIGVCVGCRCCMIRLDLLGIWDRILRIFMNPRDESISNATVHQYTVSIMDATASCMLDSVERQNPGRSLGNVRMRMKASRVWETTLIVLRRLNVTSIDATKSTQAIMSMLKVPLPHDSGILTLVLSLTYDCLCRIQHMRCRLPA